MQKNSVVASLILILLIGSIIPQTEAGPTAYASCMAACYSACAAGTLAYGVVLCAAGCATICAPLLPTPTP